MRIVCISDTHSKHDHIVVPTGDVLIHAGDLTVEGKIWEIDHAFAWLSQQPHARIIAIPGNHDWGLQLNDWLPQTLKAQFPRVELLIDQESVVEGLRVWGSPWSPFFNNWAFNFSGGRLGIKEAQRKWDQIPDDTAILITHGPPYGMLDKNLSGEYAGDSVLKSRIAHLRRLRLHVFGHVHESYGTVKTADVTYVNACCCDRDYRPTQQPIVVDL